jgi:hypothetical protein
MLKIAIQIAALHTHSRQHAAKENDVQKSDKFFMNFNDNGSKNDVHHISVCSIRQSGVLVNSSLQRLAQLFFFSY